MHPYTYMNGVYTSKELYSSVYRAVHYNHITLRADICTNTLAKQLHVKIFTV